MSIHDIQKAIQKLSAEELAKLRQWLDEYDAALWDKQIESDAGSGRLDKLIAEVVDEGPNAN